MSGQHDSTPDGPGGTPGKPPAIAGVIFNPWVNISVSILFTLGCGALTVWFASLLRDAMAAPSYDDQGLDIVGAGIGTVVMVLVTLALVGVTIFVIRWWHRVGTDWLHRDRSGADNGPSAGADRS